MLNSLDWKRLTLPMVIQLCFSALACGASFRSVNFIVTADTQELARAIGERAEECRKQLSLDWFGVELPAWDDPCLLSAKVGEALKVRGQLTYELDGQRPMRWEIQMQGPRSVLLRSVVPHEVMHAILATHFGNRLPWWAEEGVCVSVEDSLERKDLKRLLPRHSNLGEVMVLEQTFMRREYPGKGLAFYAKSYSLVSFLLEHGGKATFVAFLRDGVEDADWPSAAQVHYGHATLKDLLVAWLGSQAPGLREAHVLAAHAD
jgi:hypothetical protein